MRLKDKVVLITGAGSGLGRATALMMAREGAKIGVNDLTEEGINGTLAVLREAGAEGLALKADVSRPDQVKKMFEQLVSEWGTLDVLVNNAGIATPPGESGKRMVELVSNLSMKAINEVMTTGRMQESMKITSAYEDEWWHKLMDVNVNSTFYCTREALKIMEPKRYGKIINLSSFLGVKGGPGATAYSASKGAVAAFTRAVGQEVIGSNIVVNAVAPGWVDTPMLDTTSPEAKFFICSQTPAGRLGTVEEVASAIVYLATDEAGFFVGQVLSPNGGIMTGG